MSELATRSAQRSDDGRPRRYAIVGLGGRSYLYLLALAGNHRQDGELVGLCEANPGRLARAAAVAARRGVEVPTYEPGDFEQMLATTAPDAVIVTSPDHTHADYIVRALQSGCDVITEKPLTIDAESCRCIFAARKASGGAITVGFNYRYSPVRTLAKEVLRSGVIGPVTAVNFEWRLDTHHGADYFRRGIGRSATPAASSSTRPRITSISSIGGWLQPPARFAPRGAACSTHPRRPRGLA